jgi:hypothetical protein
LVIPLLRPSKWCSASVQVTLWTSHLSTNTHPHSLCILLTKMWTTCIAYVISEVKHTEWATISSSVTLLYKYIQYSQYVHPRNEHCT